MDKKLKVYIKTYGCQMNERDSENIAATLILRGHEICKTEKDADVILLNTCSVREAAEQKSLGKAGHICARKLETGFPIVGITGCMAQNLGAKIFRRIPNLDFVLGTRKMPYAADHIEDVAARRLAGEIALDYPKSDPRKYSAAHANIDISDDENSHNLVKEHLYNSKNPCAQISIMQGCAMNCSYCIVPKVRGVERSRSIEDIVAEAEELASKGKKQITLLGQVVNAYGRGVLPTKNGKSPFVQLLEKINEIKGIERIRFVSSHPSYFRDDLIDAYTNLEKICEYVHLPMQSGSDRVLRAMNRPYSVKKYLSIIEKLRSKKPDISISTDIIVGYPTETDFEFEETCKAFKEAGFDMAYIFKYSPRKDTKSALLPDDVEEKIKESRNEKLLEILAQQSLKFNQNLVGKTLEVLTESQAKRGDSLMGFTRSHRKVVFKGGKNLIGGNANVLIESASVSTLEGAAL